MTPDIITFAKRIRAAHTPSPGRVLEVGSYNVNGTVRDAFEEGSASYLGIDARPGPAVDRVLDANNLGGVYDKDTFDTVLCCETLEHDPFFWETADAMRRVLKPGGLLVITTPTFGFPLHRYPVDCYRFGEDAYRGFLFRGFRILDLHHLPGPIIACAGRKPGG